MDVDMEPSSSSSLSRINAAIDHANGLQRQLNGDRSNFFKTVLNNDTRSSFGSNTSRRPSTPQSVLSTGSATFQWPNLAPSSASSSSPSIAVQRHGHETYSYAPPRVPENFVPITATSPVGRSIGAANGGDDAQQNMDLGFTEGHSSSARCRNEFGRSTVLMPKSAPVNGDGNVSVSPQLPPAHSQPSGTSGPIRNNKKFDPRSTAKTMPYFSYLIESDCCPEHLQDQICQRWTDYVRPRHVGGRECLGCCWVLADGRDCWFVNKKQVVKRHILSVHMRIKRFACKKCNSRFAQKTSLTVHDAAAHTGEAKLKCPYEGCNEVFKDPARLHRHKVKMHKYEPKTTSRTKKSKGLKAVPVPDVASPGPTATSSNTGADADSWD